jgi:hypothetical protein
MADVLQALVLAKLPHIPTYGFLLGAFVIMGIGLAIAVKWPGPGGPPAPK